MKFNFHLPKTLTFLTPLTSLGDLRDTPTFSMSFLVSFVVLKTKKLWAFSNVPQCPFVLCFSMAPLMPLLVWKNIKKSFLIFFYGSALASAMYFLVPLCSFQHHIQCPQCPSVIPFAQRKQFLSNQMFLKVFLKCLSNIPTIACCNFIVSCWHSCLFVVPLPFLIILGVF